VSRSHAWLWRRYARVYDALEGLAGYREMLDAVVAAAGTPAGRHVLEVGCGTGNLLARLVSGGPARATGIDVSPAMLAAARGKLAARCPEQVAAGTVRLVEADAVAGLAELPAGEVDVLVMSNVLYALPDRPAFWREAARVLSASGRVVVSNPDTSGFLPALRQQWRERGPRGFADPRLVEVFVLNVAIDAIASTGRYAFLAWEALAAEAAEAGLPASGRPARVYGGPVDGMNVVGVLTRPA
jgi:ubiquinone/menaquinone biosynthesis C-methylase UbiE